MVDAGIVLVLGIAAVRGYVRGILRETFGMIGLIGGILAGLAYSQQLGNILIERHWLREVEAPLVAAPVIFITVYLLATILGMIAHTLAKTFLLGGIDRLGGVLFGLARGVAVCGLLLALLIHILPKDLLKMVDQSRLGPQLTTLGMTMVDAGRKFTPPEVRGSI